MIIDIHRHAAAWEWFSENYWTGLARMLLPFIARAGKEATVEKVFENILPKYFDTTGEKHIAQMEAAGIDKTVMFTFDTGMIAGEPKVGIEEQNKIIFDLAKRFPDKIIPFVSIDPRRSGAITFVKRAVEEWGARGLKIHPGSGFNPEEKEAMELIASFAGYGLPVIAHTGASIASTSSRYTDPVFLDEMLLKFPDLIVIAAHLAYGHRVQLFALGANRPNLYADFSAWQPVARRDYAEFARVLRMAVNSFGPERVLFGTDNPYLWTAMSEAEFVASVRDLPQKAPQDAPFTDKEVGMILGENACRLLGL